MSVPQLKQVPFDQLSQQSKTLVEQLRTVAEANPNGFITALTSAAHSSPVRDAMRDELKKLTQTVSFIRSKFESVQFTLRLFDNKNYKKLQADGSPGGDYVTKLGPKWTLFRDVSLLYRLFVTLFLIAIWCFLLRSSKD